MFKAYLRAALAGALVLAASPTSPAFAQTPPMTPDIPAKFA